MKKILIALGAVLALALILVIALPTILSTSWGTKHALNMLNKEIPGKLTVDDMSITWFGPQMIQNAILNDPENHFVAHFDKLTTDASLFSLIFKKGKEQNIELADFDVVIKEEANGSTNLHAALGLATPASTINKTEPPLTLQLINVFSKISLHSDKEPIQILLKGNTKQGDISGHFSFDILLEHTQLGKSNILNPIQFTADVSHFPIAIIDHFVSLANPELNGAIRTLLGDTLDLSLKQKRIETGFSFELLSQTPLSAFATEGKIENGRIQLTKQSTATLKMDPSSFNALKAFPETDIPLELLNPTTITLALNKLDLSLKFLTNKANPSEDAPPIIFGNLSMSPTAIQGPPQVGNMKINQLKLDISGTQYGKMEGKLSATLLPDDPKILSLLGSALKINIDAALEIDKNQEWIIAPYTALIQSDLLNAIAKGTFSKDQLALLEPINIDYKLLPQHLEVLGLKTKEMQVETTPLKITILPFTASLDDIFDVQQNAEIDLQSIGLKFAKGDHALLQNIKIPIKYTPNDKQIYIDFTANSLFNHSPAGSLSGRFILSHWLNAENQIDLNKAIAKVNLDIANFPSAFISTYAETPPLEDLLGPLINLHMIGSFVPTTMQGAYTLQVSGQDLTGKFIVSLNNDLISNTTPLVFSMKLTPTRFAALQKLIHAESDNKFTLLADTDVDMEISTLKVPTNFSLRNTQIVAEMSVDEIHFQREGQQKLIFENMVASVSSQNVMQSMSFQIKAEEQLKGKRYPIMVNGDAKDYFSEKGKIDTSALTLNLEVKSPRLPASLLCQLGGLDCSIRQKIEALFGEIINTDINIHLLQMHGPLFAKLKGPNGKLTLDAQLNEGSMTLNAPFEAEFAVTPELEKSIIQDVIPILNGVIGAEQPIRIKIDPASFFIPLKQIELDKIVIEKATIELGKMHFSEKGTLGNVFDLLGRSQKDELSVKFTPLYFKMDHGTIKLSRMDMLFMGHYPMAVWGKVNPVKDKVDIRIGITAAALSRAFSIPGLEKDYMMQLPLTGSLSSASIDKAKAIGRISALVAQSHGSPQGTLLGAVLGIASGELLEEPVPSPTTNPLPWDLTVEKAKNPEKSHEKGQVKNDKKKGNSGADEIEKAASSLIESLFK